MTSIFNLIGVLFPRLNIFPIGTVAKIEARTRPLFLKSRSYQPLQIRILCFQCGTKYTTAPNKHIAFNLHITLCGNRLYPSMSIIRAVEINISATTHTHCSSFITLSNDATTANVNFSL